MTRTTREPEVLISTVLFEKNRWTPDKVPTFKVSELAPALQRAGFAGLELWENHAVLIDADERAALDRLPLPVRVFNSYCTFDANGAAGRQLAIDLVRRFRAPAVKFNFGNQRERIDEYRAHLAGWLDALPAGCRALCECHGGTVLEDPAQAAEILRPFAGRIGIIVHAFAGDDDTPLRRWIEHFGPAIQHVHAASSIRPGLGFTALRGLGDLVCRRVALLDAAGFKGTWSIEFTAGVITATENIDSLLIAATDDRIFLKEVLEC